MHGITHVNCDHAMEHNSDGVGERRGEAEKKKGKVAEHVRNAIAVSGAGALFGMIIDFCSLFALSSECHGARTLATLSKWSLIRFSPGDTSKDGKELSRSLR